MALDCYSIVHPAANIKCRFGQLKINNHIEEVCKANLNIVDENSTQLFLYSAQKIHKQYYAPTESRARKAGTVKKT